MSLFISFEGMEGAGKTTQIRLLRQKLQGLGYVVTVTKEPGATEIGKVLRKLLLDDKYPIIHPFSDLCLFTAERLEHVVQVIQPALEKKQVVICDRFIDSTLAYQIGGQQLDKKTVQDLVALVKLKPDITLLLDVDLEEGLERVFKRKKVDRYEKKELAFHQRVREHFLSLAKQEQDRFCCINTSKQSLTKTHQDILAAVLKRLTKTMVLHHTS